MSDVETDMKGTAPASAAAEHEEKRFVRLPCEDYNLTNFAKEVGGILNRNGVYRRGRMIMTVDAERGVLEEMDANRFCTYVEKSCTPAKFFFDRKTGAIDKREMTMTTETSRKTMAADAFVEMQRPILRVNRVPSPVWRRSGPGTNKIELLGEGYDAESQTYTVGVPGVEVRSDMQKEEAVSVLRDELLKEFPFGERDAATGVSRAEAVHVALMLSIYAPGLIPIGSSRPGALWMANASRTGKTLLAKTAQIPVYGTAKVTPMKTDEEFDKVLDTAAIEAWPALFLDNLKGHLNSATLDAFMTSQTWSGRAMGGQKSFEAVRMTQVLITGNNLGLSEDLEERFLICDLHLEDMDPRARKIERVMTEEWLAEPSTRSRILTALWTLISDWDASGRVVSKMTIPGFERWSEVYGGIVEHAGLGNPIVRPKLAYGGNDWKRDMMVLLTALADEIKTPKKMGTEELQAQEDAEAKTRKSRGFTFQELIDCSRELDCFNDGISGREHKDKQSDKVTFEPDNKTRSRMGKYFGAQFGGRIGVLEDGRRVRFGDRNKQRHHRFIVELL